MFSSLLFPLLNCYLFGTITIIFMLSKKKKQMQETFVINMCWLVFGIGRIKKEYFNYFTAPTLYGISPVNSSHRTTPKDQTSTFSEQGSLRITSGAIQATVPANDILVLFSFHSRLVPKSEIFKVSLFATRTLWKKKQILLIKLRYVWRSISTRRKFDFEKSSS